MYKDGDFSFDVYGWEDPYTDIDTGRIEGGYERLSKGLTADLYYWIGKEIKLNE